MPIPSFARCVLPWLAASLLIAGMGNTHAQWTWRDKNGQVNASDRPPPRDIPEKDILSRPVPEAARRPAAAAPAGSAPVAVVPAQGKGPLDKELEARKRATEQEQAAKTRADEEKASAQRAENCRRARAHMAALETGQRIARMNDKGEREILDDRGRADEMRQAREVIASDCR